MSDVNYMRVALNAKCNSCDWQGNDWDAEKNESTEDSPGQFIVNTVMICPKCGGDQIEVEKLEPLQVVTFNEEKKEVVEEAIKLDNTHYSKVTEQPTQEQVIEAAKKEVEDFKANKENQDRAYNLALAFLDIMGDKWFTLARASRKTKEKEIVVFQKLKLLQLFGHCTFKKGDDNNPDQRKKIVFKVHVSKEHELKAVEDVITSLRDQLAQALIKKNLLLIEINEQVEPLKEN